MLLAILQRLRRADDLHPPATTGEPATWLARAEAALAAARRTEAPFERDALYDEVVTAMVRATLPTLLRFCQHKLGDDPVRAEDAVQSTYLSFREALPGFEGRSALKTFLFGIAFNRCRDQRDRDARQVTLLRRHASHVAEVLHAGNAPPGVDHIAEEREREARARALEQALAELPAREAFIVRARLVEERDYAAILPEYRRRFGDGIGSLAGLRTAFFTAKQRLIRMLTGDSE